MPAPDLAPRNESFSRAVFAAFTLAWSCATAVSTAQIAPSTARSPGLGERALVLSPFVVSTEKDTGYAATNTLAGTRLNTPLTDLGASISVLTKDFLDDVGATSVNDALIYSVGMEAGGAGGNFFGGTNDITAASVQSDATRNEPQSVNRVRGLGSANLTRGFFATDIASDTYILDQITINRGANAMLVGTGNPGGVIESGRFNANPSVNRNKVQFRYGDNDSTRANVDFNRVLVRGVLGFRLAALKEDERPQQRPAFEKKDRLAGAINYHPFRRTSLHLDFETGFTRANRPFTGLPFKSISDEWWAALAQGRATNNPALYSYDWTYFDDPARNPSAASMDPFSTNIPIYQQRDLLSRFVGQGQVFGGKVLVYNAPNATAPSVGYFATNPPSTTTFQANRVRSNVFDPVFNKDTAADTYFFLETLNRAELPTFLYPDNLRPAGVKFQGFSDYAAFDWRNRQIDETGRQNDNFNTLTLTAEQRFWQDRLGVELSYYRQRYENRNRNAFFSTGGNGNHIRIDPNVSLQNGLPNPNFGRPYAVFQQTADNNTIRRREARRATGFARYDFAERWPTVGKWIGQHTLSGVLEQQSRNDLTWQTSMTNTNGANLAPGAIPPNGFNDRPYMVVYMGPSVLDGTPLTLNPIQLPHPRNGDTFQTLFPYAEEGDRRQAVYGTEPNVLREILRFVQAQREVIRSQAFAYQVYWLDNLIVTTAGWRRDERYFTSVRPTVNGSSPTSFGFDSVWNNAAVTPNVVQSFPLPNLPPRTNAAEKKSLSNVFRWPEKLLRLPRGVSLSAFLNRSENFSPSGTRVRLDASPIDPASGTTREYGLNLSLFENRVFLRYTNYETKSVNQSASGALVGTIQNNAVNQLNGQIIQGASTISDPEARAQAEALRVRLVNQAVDAIPGFREAYKVSIDRDANGNLTYRSTSFTGLADTVDSVAKGHELELVVNPTRHWRISANVAKQRTVVSNVQPGARYAMEKLWPVWNQPDFANLPRSTESTLSYLTTLVYVPYLNILSSEGLAPAEQRKWRANLVTNYTFPTRWLKGVGVGGAVRWQDKVGIGYVTERDPANRSIIRIDRSRPYFAPDTTNVDLFASYDRRIWRDKIAWKIQLNLRNAFGTSELIPINAQYDGTVASYRVPPEKRVYLTNTFTF